jgi:hypothetical protein
MIVQDEAGHLTVFDTIQDGTGIVPRHMLPLREGVVHLKSYVISPYANKVVMGWHRNRKPYSIGFNLKPHVIHFGAPREIRTPNILILNQAPLPVGLLGHKVSMLE